MPLVLRILYACKVRRRVLQFPTFLVVTSLSNAAQKIKFSTKDFFSKYDQIHSFLRIWLPLPKKSTIENFTFYTVKSYAKAYPGTF